MWFFLSFSLFALSLPLSIAVCVSHRQDVKLNASERESTLPYACCIFRSHFHCFHHRIDPLNLLYRKSIRLLIFTIFARVIAIPQQHYHNYAFRWLLFGLALAYSHASRLNSIQKSFCIRCLTHPSKCTLFCLRTRTHTRTR